MTVKPELYEWACNRGDVDPQKLRQRFPMFDEWVSGTKQPTIKQLEKFAKFTTVPLGALFLSKPYEEELPIQDLRTMRNQKIVTPSANLLDTIYMCQQRQDWYQTFAISEGAKSLRFVGSVTVNSDIHDVAKDIRTALDFSVQSREQLPNWSYALRYFTEKADDLGILVMISGVVRNNSHRKLDPHEFRGFTLADDIAPLVFINGSDSKAAQIFTLAHELAHVWLGESSLSNSSLHSPPTHVIEKWCNQVAAELLVPALLLNDHFRDDIDLSFEIQRLSKQYKVSTIVILRRLYDLDMIDQTVFSEQYRSELKQYTPKRSRGGGNFYATLKTRVGARFGEALVDSALSGKTVFTDALYYLGIQKISTLESFAKTLYEE
ncbi:MAG: ImmA/IrrE family metallo-endopeptidase [Bacteroidetes bacterium]|nr:ImmA/IrrE family metallo-endopeptidase [Bacteroidota bacterium]